MKIHSLSLFKLLTSIKAKNISKALAILIASLIITIIGTIFSKNDSEKQLLHNYVDVCSELSQKISSRLNAHKLILRTVSAFLETSDTVTRLQWKKFTEEANLINELPGTLGIGYTIIIPKNKLANHIKTIQNEGYSDYTIRPSGNREIYTSIIFLEPFTGRNLRAFGYDMFSEPVRRKALEKSRDNDIAALTGKVTLVQETNENVQAGTLMFVPVYRAGMPITTIEQRRKAIKGWVYSPYRMNDLMQGILGRWDLAITERIHLQVYDDSVSTYSLLYDSQNKSELSDSADPKNTIQIPVEINGTKWILKFTQSYDQAFSLPSKSKIVLLCGIAISFLLYFLSYSLFNTKYNARLIAEQLTSEIKESELRWKFAIEGSGDGLWDWNMENNTVFFSRQWKTMLGFNDSEIKNNLEEWSKRVHPDDLKKCYADIQLHLEGKVPIYSNIHRVLCKDGLYKYILDRGKVIEINNEGKPKRMIGTHSDLSGRIAIEQALKEKEERISILMNSTAEAIYGIDLDGNCTYVNKACIEILGYSSENDFIGRNIHKLIHHSYRDGSRIDESKCQVNSAFHKGLSVHVDSEVLWRKDGTCFDAEYSSYPQFKEDQILGAVVVFADITEKRKAEDIIKAESQRFITVMNSMNTGVYVSDFDTYELLFTNKYFKDMFGEPHENKCFAARIKGQTKPCEFCTNNILLDQTRNINEPYTWEFKNPETNRWYHLHDQVIKWINGKNVKMEIVTDITNLKNAEFAVRESESKTKAILHTLPDMVFIQNSDGIFIDYFVPEGIETAIPSEIIIGENMQNVLPENVVNQFLPVFETAINTKQMQIFKYSLNINNKESFYEARILCYDDNKVLSIVRDITESYLAEETIKEQNLELKKLNADKDRFMSIIAHDLRSPFASITGLSELALEEIKNNNISELPEYLQMLRDSSSRAFDLLNNLLEWTRSQTGRIKYNPEENTMSSIIFDNIFYMKEIARKKNIEIILDIKADTAVFCDTKMIDTVLRNLISNAIKFTNSGKKIVISTEIKDFEMLVSIVDEGIGMSKEAKDKLFKIDTTITTLGTENEQGSGLGLILCKEFIDKHNTKIWVQSELGKGSSFNFTIPLYIE